MCYSITNRSSIEEIQSHTDENLVFETSKKLLVYDK